MENIIAFMPQKHNAAVKKVSQFQIFHIQYAYVFDRELGKVKISPAIGLDTQTHEAKTPWLKFTSAAG